MKHFKWLALIAAAVFAMGFVACSDGDDGGSGNNGNNSGNSGNTETTDGNATTVAETKTTPDAVGDIVLSDGTAISAASASKMSSEQKSKAVAVIFYVGSESDVLGKKTLGVGLKNTGADNTLQWAPENTTGYTTNFTDIQCTISTTAPSEGTAYYSCTYSWTTYYVTGDFDGSDNWAKVCAADNTASENAATNYPAFNWVNNYATTNSLTGDMATGWYLPSCVELRILYDNKATVNAALEAAGGTKIADTGDTGYWSSSEDSSFNSFNGNACSVWFDDGSLYGSAYKDLDGSVCGVRAF